MGRVICPAPLTASDEESKDRSVGSSPAEPDRAFVPSTDHGSAPASRVSVADARTSGPEVLSSDDAAPEDNIEDAQWLREREDPVGRWRYAGGDPPGSARQGLAGDRSRVRRHVRADLRAANLRGTGLQNADLRGANLEDATLEVTFIYGAALREAVLRDAALREAVLRDMVAGPVNVSNADLRGADLRGSRLSCRIAPFGRQRCRRISVVPTCAVSISARPGLAPRFSMEPIGEVRM